MKYTKKIHKKKIIDLIKKIFMIIGIIMTICFFTKITHLKNQVEFVNNKIPADLNKSFYMENNGSYGNIVNMSNGYMIDKNTFILPSITNSAFTTDKSLYGLLSSLFFYLTDSKYQIKFDPNHTNGKIDIILFNFLKVPSSFVNFTIAKIPNSSNWLRESTILGLKTNYILKDLSLLSPEELAKIPKSALMFK